jgi:hypothetical protein
MNKKFKVIGIIAISALALVAVVGLVSAQMNGGITIPIKFQVSAEVVGLNQSLGAYIASPTGLTDLNVTNDLVVDKQSTLTGTTTVQEITYGSRFGKSLDFATAATTTGSLIALTNTGDTKICQKAEVLFDTPSNGTGSLAVQFSLGTSTSATAFSSGLATSLIATTTIPTSTTVLLNTVTNIGTANQDSWIWNNGETILGGIVFSNHAKASTTAYTSRTGKMWVTCHTK